MCTASLIGKLSEVLAWSDHSRTLQQIHDRYLKTVSDRLGVLVSALGRDNPALAKQVEDALNGASHSALLRVVLAPETSHRLLWEQPQRLQETAEFFHRSLLAESAKEGRPGALAEETWTAPGDALVLPTGEVITGPSIEGWIPLDFDSPQVRNADRMEFRRDQGPPHLLASRRETVLHQLALAQRGIAATSSEVNAFTAHFIKVLVLQNDDEDLSFSTYSTQQYPGRAVIHNPHLVDVAQVAEAVVHEAIHALLYFLLQTHPWGIEDPRFPDTPKVVSPWTGRMLPVSTFLHACFVWYGLLHFWSVAFARKTFPPRRVRGRISRAALGFLGPPLLELIAEADVVRVAAPVRAAIQTMQARVMEAGRKADSQVSESMS